MEEGLVKFVFSNQLLFCVLFGALGGLVHSIDFNYRVKFGVIINKIIVSASASILLFFLTYDLDKFTPALRIAASIVTGFYGSAIFRWAAKFYLKQAAGIFGVDDSKLLEREERQNEDR